jgi:hypothetical protein
MAKKVTVMNKRSGRVLRIRVNGVTRDFSKPEKEIVDEAKQEVWLNIKSRARYNSYRMNYMPNSEVRHIDPTGYIRETKPEWSMMTRRY